MSRWLPAFVVLALAGFSHAQEALPLPQAGPPPMRGDGAFIKPTVSIAPPPSVCPPKAESKELSARELALIEQERKIIANEAQKQVANEAKKGNAAALRQLIVMLGPVDAAMSRSPTPPVSKDRIALIGFEGKSVAQTAVEQFFGAPLTPEREQQLLDAVKSQMADKGNIEVKVAGWWPQEGVIAVSVVPAAKKS